MVYIDYNSTHYENVNKALLVENYAVIYDFSNNEFNPSEWTLYVSKTTIPEFSPNIILLIVMVITILTIGFYRKIAGSAKT